MTKVSQQHGKTIRPMHYASARAAGLPAEIVSRAELLRRFSPEFLGLPERLHFHLLVFCHAGSGSHWVDFERVPIAADALLYIAPGQVQQYDLTSQFDARMLVVPPAVTLFPAPGAGMPARGAQWVLDSEDAASFARLFDELEYEQQHYDGSAAADDLISSLVAVGRCRLARLGAGSSAHADVPPLFVAFELLVESNYHRERAACWYARRLGCSSRTLARAVQRARGLSPKAFIDARIALEAKRLLAYRSGRTSIIAEELGFAEVTHFGRFFQRLSGETPASFRSRWRLLSRHAATTEPPLRKNQD